MPPSIKSPFILARECGVSRYAHCLGDPYHLCQLQRTIPTGHHSRVQDPDMRLKTT